MNSAPILIVGSPRSGTTLLASLLNAHPQIAIPPEEDLILSLYPQFGKQNPADRKVVRQFGEALFQSPTFRYFNLPKEDLLRQLEAREYAGFADLAAEVYRIYARSISPGKTRWGAKEPYFAKHLKLLHGLYPDFKVIHIIRDGRDVLLSMRDREKKGPSNFATGAGMAALQWEAIVRRGCRDGRRLGPDRYSEVRYEDLVADPQPSMERLCEFVGVPFTTEMISGYYGNVVDKQLLRLDNLDNYLLKEITTNRSQRWRKELTEDDLRTYESIAGALLKEFGYELANEKLPVTAAIRGLTCSMVYRAYGAARDALRPIG